MKSGFGREIGEASETAIEFSLQISGGATRSDLFTGHLRLAREFENCRSIHLPRPYFSSSFGDNGEFSGVGK